MTDVARLEPQTDQCESRSGLLRLFVDEDAKSEVNAVAESSADDEAGSTRSGDARIGTWARLGRSVLFGMSAYRTMRSGLSSGYGIGASEKFIRLTRAPEYRCSRIATPRQRCSDRPSSRRRQGQEAAPSLRIAAAFSGRHCGSAVTAALVVDGEDCSSANGLRQEYWRRMVWHHLSVTPDLDCREHENRREQRQEQCRPAPPAAGVPFIDAVERNGASLSPASARTAPDEDGSRRSASDPIREPDGRTQALHARACGRPSPSRQPSSRVSSRSCAALPADVRTAVLSHRELGVVLPEQCQRLTKGL